MAGRIRILDEATVNKIAAGEVVERPASVVKELIENSLDAGASSVHVSVEDGGRQRIAVSDDGCGMSREDAVLAFQRHATSKISSLDDLRRLASYGFRGEALSSIAAVSTVVLRTRERGSAEGTEVVVSGGKVKRVSPVGCPPGTEVVVDGLFADMPARRKSLRSSRVELAHCRDVVVDYILCRPGLSFSFESEGETELVHVPAEGMKGSLALAFGPKVAETVLFGDAEAEGVRVEAHLGRLEHARSHAGDMRIFVNDRPVKAPKLLSAVVGAYGSRLMKDRYPVGVIRLFVDSSELDVNVHPAKREVRFSDEAKVFDAVTRCVQKALEGSDLAYRYHLTAFSDGFEPKPSIPRPESVQTVQSRLEVQGPAACELPAGASIVPLAQVMGTYILAESKGNLLLIDQHAASERVMYEKLLRAIESGKDVSQRLLTPLVMTLTQTELKVLEEHKEALERAGFAVDPFGKNAYALRSIPTVLGVPQGESAFRNVLADLARSAPSKKLGLDVIWRVACHSAVRAGDILSEAEMRALVSDLMRTENPFTCEHGRPTMIVLSPADLEKLFKRRV